MDACLGPCLCLVVLEPKLYCLQSRLHPPSHILPLHLTLRLAAQEPGTNNEIKRFATSNYGVTFPLMAKVRGGCMVMGGCVHMAQGMPSLGPHVLAASPGHKPGHAGPITPPQNESF